MDKRMLAAAAVFAVAVLALSLGGGRDADEQTIRVSGAWALYPMMVKWADEYQKTHANVKVEVNAGGAGKGMADALGGLVDIGMVSRDIDPSEVEKGAYGLAVVKDAVIPTMNKDNPVAADIHSKGLTKGQFQAIFVAGNLTRWGDAVGRAVAADKISVYVRSDSCGAAEIWAKYLGGKQEDLVGVGVNADPGIAEAVSRDPRGIGFNNLNFAYDDKSGLPAGNLMMIPIDANGDGQITSEESFYATKAEMVAAIADGRYPSPPSRDLYIVGKGGFSGPTREFVKWVLTDGQSFVLPTGYIPLTEDNLKAQLARLG
jgi:phosphate transport system substrate-binding protein